MLSAENPLVLRRGNRYASTAIASITRRSPSRRRPRSGWTTRPAPATSGHARSFRALPPRSPACPFEPMRLPSVPALLVATLLRDDALPIAGGVAIDGGAEVVP